MARITHSDFDVIVVGGGHAGIEAAYAAARMGSKTLLLTLDINKIGLMRCNPAIGGVGKGHIVFEISALGGLMPKLCTKTYLQARMLNTSKGPAVQGLRLQIDKHAYNQLSVETLSNTPNLTLHAGSVEDIITDEHQTARAIRLADGTQFSASCIILTTGTFLNGLIHVGTEQKSGGGSGEAAVLGITPFLKKMNLNLGRLKTGTPPRLKRDSLDFSKMERQAPDNLNYLFEFYGHKVTNSHDCFITHTNENTHQIIRDNLHLSAMYSGNIKGVGPRYCPSIEDKVARFAHKSSHHVFVEPESASCDEIYPNGISTSLPLAVQQQYINSIAGFERAVIARAGYAIEYDFVLPNQLNHTLELKTVPRLFLAGQINGTTGYEEAAGQGAIAGINAHLKAHGLRPFILERTESYIGILIDDLVTMSVDEPYRMFTSRAERRLLLRQDNAFLRLMPKAYELGLIDEQLYADFNEEKNIIMQAVAQLKAHKNLSEMLALFENPETASTRLSAYLNKPFSERTAQTIHAELLYGPYLEREEREVKRSLQYKTLAIPAGVVFSEIPGLSKELQEKLNRYKPETIAQAALIPGMTPAAISLLIFRTRSVLGSI